MKPRKLRKYKSLFSQYCKLDERQSIKKDEKWQELQEKKIAILDEMEVCFT